MTHAGRVHKISTKAEETSKRIIAPNSKTKVIRS